MSRAFMLIAGLMMVLRGNTETTNWHIEMVDQSGTGRFSSLKIDKQGNVHVAYVVDDGGQYPLKYGFWDHTLHKWFGMTVDESASYCSLVLDSKQRPHISYADYGTTNGAKLKYASWDGTSWRKQAIPLNAEIIAYYTSIVLDTNDNPSISFYEYTGPRGTDLRVRMRVVTKDAGYWQVKTVDGQNQSGKFNALAIDSQGHLRLAYANVNALTASVRYGYWDGKSWKVELVDGHEQNNQDNVGYSICIALDKEGDPHLSYMNYSNPAVKYAVRKNGQWRTQVIERLAGVAYPDRNSIVLDEAGNPYISYYDSGRGVLKLAHLEGQKWVGEIIDSNASGVTSSIQIDRGTIWISYADEGNGGLKVASRESRVANASGVPKVTESKPVPRQ